MSVTLESLSEQVIVITSATRGLGFMTVVSAHDRGGKLVLAPREGAVLSETVRCVPRCDAPRH